MYNATSIYFKSSNFIDAYAERENLKLNRSKHSFSNLLSFASLFAPAIGFGIFLVLIHFEVIGTTNFKILDSRLELSIIVLSGVIATIGGVCDWIFHRLFVTTGPNEHKSHLLALGTGGIPIFCLMTVASLIADPGILLVPIIVCLLYTTTLICYDEFIFHYQRCRRLENIFHRMLVFGNGIAFLAWLNIIYK